MIRSIIILLFFIMQASFAKDVFVNVGESTSISVPIKFSNNTAELNLSVINSNPLVFFIDSLKSLKSDSVIDFDKSFDSLNLTFIYSTPAIDDTLIIYGEALAGNDSLTIVTLNPHPFADTDTIAIHSEFFGGRLPYSRFIYMSDVYPNPTFNFETVTVKIITDLGGDFDLLLYDLIGNEYKIKDLNNLAPGEHLIEFTMGFKFSAGFYLIKISGETGEAIKSMIIK